MSKILVLDIETMPAISYHWQLFDVNISLDQLITPSRIYAVGAKWVGQPDVYYFEAKRPSQQKRMLKAVHKLLMEADAVVTYNGERFDLPWLLGEFAKYGLPPPPPPTSIDLIKTVKKFKLQSNKLQYALTYFGLGSKVDTGGFQLWREVYEGSPEARELMQTYCIGDVHGEEALYGKLRPYIENHPYLGPAKVDHICSLCGSKSHKRGERRSKFYAVDRMQCTNKACGHWDKGPRRKL